MPDIQPQIDKDSTLQRVILRITKDGVFLESIGRVAVLRIDYSGELKADVVGRNVVGVNRDTMIICFVDKVHTPFMKIIGRYEFKRVTAYSFDGKARNVTIILEDDKVQTMRTEWDTSDSKYEDLNYAYDGKRVRKTSVTYFDGNKEVTVNDKGKRIRSK